MLTKQEILLGKGPWAESSRVMEPTRTALPCLALSGFMVMGLVYLTQSPSGWHTHCSAKMDASKKDSGRWLDTWCHLLTFPKLFLLVVAY